MSSELELCRCCACGVAPPNRNVVMLEALAQWEYPTAGNVVTGQRGRALAVLCERCSDKQTAPVEAIQFRPDGQIIYHRISELEQGEPWATKIYHVSRNARGVECTVSDLRGENYPLPHVVVHSPTGFEIGYGGSGPADLALSIACDHYGVKAGYDFHKLSEETEDDRRARRAWRLHQPLKRAYLSSVYVRDGVKISDREIAAIAREVGIGQ